MWALQVAADEHQSRVLLGLNRLYTPPIPLFLQTHVITFMDVNLLCVLKTERDRFRFSPKDFLFKYVDSI